MSIQIEEIRAAAEFNETYSGSLNGQLAEFYRTTGNPSSVLVGLEAEWLSLMGFDDDGLNDKWTSYLSSLGFTGVLKDNLQLEANQRNLFPQPFTGILYSILLEDNTFLLTEDGFHLQLES